MTHINYSKQILDSFFEKVEDIAVVDKPPKMEGRSMVMFFVKEALIKCVICRSFCETFFNK